MTFREPFKTLMSLEIGERHLVAPQPGESPEEALKRLKKRFSTWRKHQRSYVAEIKDDMIEVQRTAFGANKKLWRWEAMSAGQTMVLNEEPTEADIRSARNTANYLMSVKGAAGVWVIRLDRQGRLITRCVVDRNGQSAPVQEKRVLDTAEQTRAQQIGAYRGIAEELRRQAGRASPGMKHELLLNAGRAVAKAEELELAAARTDSPGEPSHD